VEAVSLVDSSNSDLAAQPFQSPPVLPRVESQRLQACPPKLRRVQPLVCPDLHEFSPPPLSSGICKAPHLKPRTTPSIPLTPLDLQSRRKDSLAVPLRDKRCPILAMPPIFTFRRQQCAKIDML
jgi:hypothetical protein